MAFGEACRVMGCLLCVEFGLEFGYKKRGGFNNTLSGSICELMSRDWPVRVQHVFREGNTYTD